MPVQDSHPTITGYSPDINNINSNNNSNNSNNNGNPENHIPRRRICFHHDLIQYVLNLKNINTRRRIKRYITEDDVRYFYDITDGFNNPDSEIIIKEYLGLNRPDTNITMIDNTLIKDSLLRLYNELTDNTITTPSGFSLGSERGLNPQVTSGGKRKTRRRKPKKKRKKSRRR